nr:hypothetical protein [Escherichia coli]
MSASQAEWWAMRAIMAMGRGGVELPDDVRSLGMAALALEGLKALSKIPPDEARPLMDEMMDCVQFVPDPKNAASGDRLLKRILKKSLPVLICVRRSLSCMWIFSLPSSARYPPALSRPRQTVRGGGLR